MTIDVGGRRLLEDAAFEIDRGERVFLIGANGSGKSTLLRTILGEHPLAAGRLHVGPAVSIGYLPQQDATGDRDDGDDGGRGGGGQTAVDVLRRVRPMSEEEANNLLHRFLFARDQVRTPLSRLSHGERRRLELARFVVQGTNLLLLDEPTNHLDVPSREAFEASFDEFEGAALVVTHDRYFIERFADVVLAIEGGRLVRL
ncbi:MAG: ATP-binding cassette domain-containing protein [Dehalococcoidia bacterium]